METFAKAKEKKETQCAGQALINRSGKDTEGMPGVGIMDTKGGQLSVDGQGSYADRGLEGGAFLRA